MSLRRWSRSSPRSVSTILKCSATRSPRSPAKAGIIKPYGLAVVAPQRPEALTVLREVCVAQHARLHDVAAEWRWQPLSCGWEGSVFDLHRGWERSYPALEIPLAGPHQVLNAATAVATAEQLQGQGLPISVDGIRQGVKQVQWEGRLETVSRQPWIVLDGRIIVIPRTACAKR